jgi:hypothetical protein
VKFLEPCQSNVKVRPMLDHELRRPVHFFKCHDHSANANVQIEPPAGTSAAA